MGLEATISLTAHVTASAPPDIATFWHYIFAVRINAFREPWGGWEAWQAGRAGAIKQNAQRQQISRQDKPAQPTTQQKAKGRRITSPVLLPLDEGDGR